MKFIAGNNNNNNKNRRQWKWDTEHLRTSVCKIFITSSNFNYKIYNLQINYAPLFSLSLECCCCCCCRAFQDLSLFNYFTIRALLILNIRYTWVNGCCIRRTVQRNRFIIWHGEIYFSRIIYRYRILCFFFSLFFHSITTTKNTLAVAPLPRERTCLFFLFFFYRKQITWYYSRALLECDGGGHKMRIHSTCELCIYVSGNAKRFGMNRSQIALSVILHENGQNGETTN